LVSTSRQRETSSRKSETPEISRKSGTPRHRESKGLRGSLLLLGSERRHQESQRLQTSTKSGTPRHRECKGLRDIENVIDSEGVSYFYSVGSERRHQESQRLQVIEKVRDSESLRSHTLRIIEKVRDSKSRRKSGTPSDMRARERDSMHNRKNLETDKTPLASAVEQTLR